MPALPLRPHTLVEALDILARPALVQVTVGGPPLLIQPHALLMDVGRISEMAGIHRLGGELVVGVNSSWAGLMRSSLLHPGAACLTDAAALMEAEQPGGALLHALDATHPHNPILLALAALDAQIELAVRESPQRVIRQTLSVQNALQSAPQAPHLPLSVHFSLPLLATGSALYRESELSPLQPDAWAAAAVVSLDPAHGRIARARLALTSPESWPLLCSSVAALQGQEPKKEAVEAVVRLAQRNYPQPRASTPQFSLVLSSHLIRETLDRAIARSQST